MDRRRFAKLIAAAVVGVRVADELVPEPAAPITDELLADAGGYLVHEDFAEAIVLWHEADEKMRANTFAIDKLAKGWYHVAVRHA